jgi:NADH-quinone oxidoreductase subunit C
VVVTEERITRRTSVEELQAYLCDHHPVLCPHFSIEYGDAILLVPHDFIETAARELKNLGFDRLGMVTAVDQGEWFLLVYRLTSRRLRTAIFLKCKVARTSPVTPSFVGLWPAADWQEREVYDMYGIEFTGHPDLRRILMPEDWVGFPLRKDYDDDRMVRRPDYI